MNKKIIVNRICGCALIAVSSSIYTLERFMAIYMWVGELKKSVYPLKPILPSMLDNVFVPILFMLGLVLLIISFLRQTEDTDMENNKL